MKNNRLILIITISILIISWSCIEEVSNVNIPSVKPKLVVNAYISPGDTIVVKVHKSNPLFGKQNTYPYSDYFPAVLNAIVTISDDNGNQRIVPLLQQKELYSIDPSQFLIEKGQTYHLTVSAPSIESVSAITTVPNFETSFLEYHVDETNLSNIYGYNSSGLIIWGKIEDQPDLKNYFRLNCYFYYQGYLYGPSIYDSQVDNEFFTDASSEGGKINFKVNTWYNTWDSLVIMVFNTDYNYYSYHKSMYKFETDNPFAEPTPVYSNIDNGLGVFGSFVKTQIVVKPSK